ncbi:hypothetical protein JMJ76_0000567 [Colletotrichum scovillei]|nr:hypothetical protein JMJ76_0000567 [Colletotrichum scovillei]
MGWMKQAAVLATVAFAAVTQGQTAANGNCFPPGTQTATTSVISQMTQEKCNNFCQGYTVFGIYESAANTYTCGCGGTPTNATAVANSNCNTICPGDSTQTENCGGTAGEIHFNVQVLQQFQQLQQWHLQPLDHHDQHSHYQPDVVLFVHWQLQQLQQFVDHDYLAY